MLKSIGVTISLWILEGFDLARLPASADPSFRVLLMLIFFRLV
jgi:hypothetical protein